MKHVIALAVVLGVCVAASGAAVALSDVPAYNWYHGCGPTAAASLIGYYEMQGFTGLYDADGWSSVKETNNVKDQISSPAHNAKYDPTPDNASLPVPENTSLACWFRTSVDPLQYGWSYLSRADDSFEGYADYRGYVAESYYQSFGTQTYNFTCEDLVAEIDAGRPMMLLVDTDGNGGTDHFVPTIGYDDRGDGNLYYGCYTTWSEGESIAWKRFRAMGSTWGVGYGVFLELWARDGDFDTDGAIADLDIDLLRDNVGDGSFDLDGDGDADEDDLVLLVETLVELQDDSGRVGTRQGDCDLDGLVNATDLAVLAAGFGQAGLGWAGGNANTDDLIDATDLALMAANFGFTAPAGAVPEPMTLGLLAAGAVSVLARRRRAS